MKPAPLAALAAALLAMTAGAADLAPTVAPGLEQPAGTTPSSIRLDRKLDDPLPLHLHGDPRERTVNAASCAEYEKLRARVDGSDSALDWQVVKLQGATCDALVSCPANSWHIDSTRGHDRAAGATGSDWASDP